MAEGVEEGEPLRLGLLDSDRVEVLGDTSVVVQEQYEYGPLDLQELVPDLGRWYDPDFMQRVEVVNAVEDEPLEDREADSLGCDVLSRSLL